MSWNPVLDFFREVKATYIDLHGEKDLWYYQDDSVSFDNCLSCWIWHIGRAGHKKRFLYKEIASKLFLNEYNGMLLVKYKDLDIDWESYDGFYKECRSVVIDIYKEELILTPFRKFRNLNECEENSLENIQKRIEKASCIEVTDKLDGSMVSARLYDMHVIMSGSRALNRDESFRLKNYYDWIQNHKEYVYMFIDFPDYTFIFEGIFFNDIHIVRYDKDMEGLHLIGMRRVSDGYELPYHEVVAVAEKYGVPHVKILDMTFEEAYQDSLANTRLANEGEGYVIDIDGYKIKVKYLDYVTIHRAIGKLLSPNHIIDMVKNNKWDDFYSKIPIAYREEACTIYNNICKYVKYRSESTEKWFNKVIEEVGVDADRKTVMIAISTMVPKTYRSFVRMKYLNQELDFLKGVKYYYIKDYVDFYETAIMF